MFKVHLDDQTEYTLPVDTIDTNGVYHYLEKIDLFKNKKYILSFHNVFLSRNANYNLLDIGYSPKDVLNVSFSNPIEGYFNITDYNYQYHLLIDEYSTVFTIKEHFAQLFLTVPQNIIIQFNKKILSDEVSIHPIKSKPTNPFDVTVDNNYFIVRTFYQNKYNFVCMQNYSTIGDLKDTISIYTTKDFEIDSCFKYSDNLMNYCKQNDLPNERAIDNYPIQNLMDKIPFFEFVPDQSRLSKSYQILVEVNDINMSFQYKYEVSCSLYSNIYSIICLLEKELRIDRSLFSLTDKDGENIDCRKFLFPTDEIKLVFEISKSFNVKVIDKEYNLSYLMSLEEVKKAFKLDEQKKAIIINGHFLYEDDSHFLISHFMLNSDDLNTMTQIFVCFPLESCHLKTFKCIASDKKNGNESKFIIPDAMNVNSISRIYLKKRISSNSLKSVDSNVFEYKKEYMISYNYILSTKYASINMSVMMNENKTRVIDLIKEKKHLFQCAEVLFNNRQLIFSEFLSDIDDDEENKIEVEECERLDNIFILILINNEFSTYNYKHTYCNSTRRIINEISKKIDIKEEDLKLYADFNELYPDDDPFIISHTEFYLFLNQNSDIKHFTISNGTSLRCKITVLKEDFKILANIIADMFSVSRNEIELSVSMNSKHYDLPIQFDAGSLPENSLIEVKYKYVKSKRMIFRYNNTNVLIDINDNQPIESFIPTIQKELSITNISKTSFHFVFHQFGLSISKSFSYYKIPNDSIINIILKPSSFPISLSTIENPAKKREYIFNENDKIIDIKNHFKIQFNEATLDIFDINDHGSTLNENKRLNKNMDLTVSSKKIKIISEGSLGNKEIHISGISTVSDSLIYLKNKLHCNNIFLFTKNIEENCYEPLISDKMLREFDSQIYVHVYTSSIKFTNFNIVDKNEYLSELNTIEWLKKKYIARLTLFEPDKIIIKNNSNNEIIDKYQIIGYIMNQEDIKISVDFITKKQENSPKPKTSSPSQKGRIMPRITKIIKKIDDDDDDKETMISIKEMKRMLQLKDNEISRLKMENEIKDQKIKELECLNNQNDGNLQKNALFKFPKLISHDDLNKMTNSIKIGSDSISNVFKVVKKQEYTLKVIDSKPGRNEKDEDAYSLNFNKLKRLLKEAEILSSINHPNIIKTNGLSFGDETHEPCLLLEYFSSNLNDCVKILSNEQQLSIIIEICDAMKYLHESNIIHRNLNLENIFLDDNKHVKLSAFHKSTFIESDSDMLNRTQITGKHVFMAPELINGKTDYNEKVDVYAFGMVMYLILMKGEYPEIDFKDISKGKNIEIPPTVSKLSQKIMKSCLSFDASKRPAFKSIYKLIQINKNNII